MLPSPTEPPDAVASKSGESDSPPSRPTTCRLRRAAVVALGVMLAAVVAWATLPGGQPRPVWEVSLKGQAWVLPGTSERSVLVAKPNAGESYVPLRVFDRTDGRAVAHFTPRFDVSPPPAVKTRPDLLDPLHAVQSFADLPDGRTVLALGPFVVVGTLAEELTDARFLWLPSDAPQTLHVTSFLAVDATASPPRLVAGVFTTTMSDDIERGSVDVPDPTVSYATIALSEVDRLPPGGHGTMTHHSLPIAPKAVANEPPAQNAMPDGSTASIGEASPSTASPSETSPDLAAASVLGLSCALPAELMALAGGRLLLLGYEREIPCVQSRAPPPIEHSLIDSRTGRAVADLSQVATVWDDRTLILDESMVGGKETGVAGWTFVRVPEAAIGSVPFDQWPRRTWTSDEFPDEFVQSLRFRGLLPEPGFRTFDLSTDWYFRRRIGIETVAYSLGRFTGDPVAPATTVDSRRLPISNSRTRVFGRPAALRPGSLSITPDGRHALQLLPHSNTTSLRCYDLDAFWAPPTPRR